MLVVSFFYSPWIGLVLDALDIAVEATRSFLLVYILINVVAAGMLVAVRSLPPALVEWTVMVTSLVDGIFLATLTLVTGGYSSGKRGQKKFHRRASSPNDRPSTNPEQRHALRTSIPASDHVDQEYTTSRNEARGFDGNIQRSKPTARSRAIENETTKHRNGRHP